MNRLAIIVAAVGVAALAVAAWLFPRALPLVALEQSLTREVALARADSFLRVHSLAPSEARTAVRFHGNDSLRTFVELAGGGHDSLNALVRGDDVAPYSWTVRAFVSGDPREARVSFAPDGRIIGFERRLAETDRRPAVSPDSGQRLAETVLNTWIDGGADQWKLVTTSYETKKTSGRIDRTYTFERTDRRIAGAPIRADVGIAGNIPVRVRPYVEIPQSFRRRYAEMRSANEILTLVAVFGMLGIVILGIIALNRYARARRVRWREAMAVGLAVGALALVAGINAMPGSWFSYDTAMSPVTFRVTQFLQAILAGVLTALLLGFTLAAAEAANRHAFPRHLDWWKLWRYRGTTEVASQVAGGYAVAAIGLAYVVVFYLATRKLFGWWVPTQLLDDPNQIATPMPWISAIAVSLNAGVWEEALFRALPLSLLSVWIGQRSGRRWWMAAGVVGTALIFGFAHASYESWPPYSRGVELFLEACLWAVLFINFGLLLTVVAHFAYDLVLFGLFAGSGSATEYRVTAAIILLALLAPALAIAWRRVRQRGLTSAPEDARFAAWTPVAAAEPPATTAPRQAGVFTTRARRLALAAAVTGAIIAVTAPPKPPLGPPFTAERERVIQTADSMLVAHGGNPAEWKRLTSTAKDTLEAWPRFLRKHNLIPDAQRLAATYAPPTWWVVRYVHTTGTAAERAEEWRIRVWPDGRPLDTRHIVLDSAVRGAADSTTVRSIALAALARDGIDTTKLQEAELRETARPARRDVTLTYTDTSVKLPAGAAARAWAEIAGDDPLFVRRGVELSETFLRADRARQTNRLTIAGLSVLLLLGLLIAGAIIVKRRRSVLVDDGNLDRRATVVFIGTLIVLIILGNLNSLRPALFAYDTTEPWAWSAFIGSTALGFLLAIPYALVGFGLWLAVAAMRRRVGIPMLAGEPSRSTSRDMLIAGLGIGGIVYTLTEWDSLLLRGRLPETPATTLNEIAPLFAALPGIPMSVLLGVAMAGLPLLVLAGLTPRRSYRALGIAVFLALVGVIIWAVRTFDPATATLATASVITGLVALAVWGSLSAWSWIVGALAYQGFEGLRNAVYAPVWQERGSGALVVLVASLLIVLIVRHTARTRQPQQRSPE